MHAHAYSHTFPTALVSRRNAPRTRCSTAFHVISPMQALPTACSQSTMNRPAQLTLSRLPAFWSAYASTQPDALVLPVEGCSQSTRKGKKGYTARQRCRLKQRMCVRARALACLGAGEFERERERASTRMRAAWVVYLL